MKKILLITTAILTVGVASAENNKSNMTGVYAGVNLGVNTMGGHYRLENQNNQDVLVKSALHGSSLVGGLFGGYGMSFSNMYVGGELYTVFGNNKALLLYRTRAKTSIRNTWNIGGKLRLGYQVTDNSILFLGLGVEHGKYTFKQKRQTDIIKKTKNLTSFAPSVGTDIFLSKNLFTRLEYTYVNVPVWKDTDGSYDGPVNKKAYLSQHRFTLGMGYKF